MDAPFVDIHCHMVPGIDDGASDANESLAMAQIAVDEGFDTVICTPHQLGQFARNTKQRVGAAVTELQELLDSANIPLRVLPGADVRIDNNLPERIAADEVETLGGHGRHVLLELPHEVYFPLEPLLGALEAKGITGILSHPERNQGILSRPSLLEPLVAGGCLMQVTAGSLTGHFGAASRALAEQMARRGLVHFLATDAHGSKSRRPKIQAAFARACELAGEDAALQWCCEFPRLVAEGREVPSGVVSTNTPRRSAWRFFAKAG
ncbi:Tyrosine-protein phosphatase YwqE [Pirellulimonas nuda]|uniref:protein-tyrosine-phosphatase n=1 Tax=Pirellulimonas nuda TaxID=2528009 RepID=A0A518D899_9BACT|nr:CpsB/CapC family capsule biosynthesis tyrosine phosphatase [Pirellulimonas nuda]QDU87684.1 Tyrosine-protein phosphatase YwqE [Pirellulimonas nuda]